MRSKNFLYRSASSFLFSSPPSVLSRDHQNSLSSLRRASDFDKFTSVSSSEAPLVRGLRE